jgi:hypothetical protein
MFYLFRRCIVLELDSRLALDLTSRLAAWASLVATLEMLAVRKEFHEGGAFSLSSISSLYWNQASGLRRIGLWFPQLLIVLACSSAAAVAFGPYSIAGRTALAVCVICRVVTRWRRLLGGDGAEQITTLCLVASALAVLPMPSATRILCAVSFLAAQLTLSYVVAGIAKLMSPAWRSGDALTAIMSTDTYGHPAARAVFLRWPVSGAALGWFVIAFECSFPLLLLGPAPLAYTALAIGLGFHVACAATMGLNNFLLAFPAAYPCAVVVRDAVSPWS